MDSSPPFPLEPGERILAAIVFTDVVDFSARVQAEEVGTLSLLEQDFATMTKYAERYSGWVLKSTGDGLLLYFNSAVHAVTCALQIQQHFLKRAKSEPTSQVLTHRVGIHLGDVFVKDQDVMGDGVNIAARLQHVADPGGICISQTVLDVVKNKLDLSVERLAPRELKNITEVGAMYRILLEPRPVAPTPTTFRPPPRVDKPAFSRTEKLIALVVVLLGLAGAAKFLIQQDQSQKAQIEESRATQAAVDSILKSKPPADPHTPSGAESASSAAPLADDRFSQVLLDPAARRAQTPAQAEAMRQKALACVEPLASWVKTALRRYTRTTPLLVPRISATMASGMTAYAEPDGKLVLATGGAARLRDWDELKPADQAGLIVGTLQDSLTPPPAEIRLGAEAFAYLHDDVDMAAALRSRHD